MITYFTKMFQAVPSLIGLHDHLGGKFVTTRQSTKKAIQRIYPDADIQLMRQWWPQLYSGYRTLQQSDLIVTGSPNNALLKQFVAKKAMVFHGTFAPLSIEEITKMSHFDYLCTIGPRMRHIVEQAGMREKVIETGYLPFLHYPQRSLTQKTLFLSTHHFNPELPLVVYLPAGRPIGSWDLLAEALVKQLPADKFNLLLRPHPSHSVTARRRDKLSFKRLQVLCEERPNTMLDLTALDLSALYSFADLVISDGTSPAEESLFYDVPQLLVESSVYGFAQAKKVLEDKMLDPGHVSKVLEVYSTGPHLQVSSQTIFTEVSYALKYSAQYADQRESYFKYVFGHEQYGKTGHSGLLKKQKHLLEVLKPYC